MRKAGQPDVVEQIASFLGDNALTRSWHGSVTRAINAAEIPLQSEDDLRGLAADAMARRVAAEIAAEDGKYLGTDFAKEFGAFAGLSPETDLASFSVQELGGGLRHDLANADRRRALEYLAYARQHPDAQRGLTSIGDVVRMVLGNPVAAYSGVTAGGALGVVGLMEALEMLQSQGKPEKKKDSEKKSESKNEKPKEEKLQPVQA